MSDVLKTDICVIGAGSGGLFVAAGASQMGAPTVLIEKDKMGGDCLNTGCVPSKALLAAGHAAEAIREAHHFGVNTNAPTFESAKVYGHVHDTIAAIEPNDSVERFEGFGVNVIKATAKFTGPKEVEAGGQQIQARRFVIATGSRAFVPPIPGIKDVPYLTNETVFEQKKLPDHLIVVGGGPIGIEMAQAHRHLGAQVTVLEMFAIMPKDDQELVDVVRAQLSKDGITIREGVKVSSVAKSESGIVVTIENNGATEQIEGSHILVAAGRKPNVDGLDLEKAGVTYSPKGIDVDARLRTSNKKIFAIGDVAGEYQFTHVAGYHAGIVIRNALFQLPAKVDYKAVPWVTYTAPELAQVGMTEEQARKEEGDDIRVLNWPFEENDRAQAERATAGLVKVVTAKNGKILGAGIVGAHAGELLQTWVLAVSQGLKIGAVANIIAPYPTLGEVNKRAAGSFYTPSLFSERTKKVVRFLSHFG
jgi:pyruvate/2-oxoglutarate dehydrogenase complex dihydrolipoamide dehydrogenase (E3) component